jgi:hypothetical protein
MSENIEKPKTSGFKPFLIVFGGLVVLIVVIKLLMDVLM